VNLPNQLTLGRLVLTVLFLGVVFLPFPGHETVALVLFSAAGITDYLDGRIARERGLITRFGTLMDPLADKILTCSAFIAFVGQGLVPAWIAVIIVARELAITGLRLLAASNQVVLAAERYGKHKTISQIVTIILLLVWLAAPDWGRFGEMLLGVSVGGKPVLEGVVVVSQYITVLFTLYSGAVYLWRNRALYMRDL
jgi:CDP-diacylglycerol---glycerol-3-phosphate 3-phosphatidyltransferase